MWPTKTRLTRLSALTVQSPPRLLVTSIKPFISKKPPYRRDLLSSLSIRSFSYHYEDRQDKYFAVSDYVYLVHIYHRFLEIRNSYSVGAVLILSPR